MELLEYVEQMVDEIAQLKNPQVVQWALAKLEGEPCCKFAANRHVFYERLILYRRRRLHHTKCKRRLGLSGLESTLAFEHELLHSMWPCPECIMRENPTGRTTYNGRTLPRRVFH